MLAATLYTKAPEASRVAIICSATAVPRRFYRHYARALAEAGFAAITFDYRGIGDSRPASLRGFEARTREWGLLDMAGLIDWVHEEMQPDSLFLVGHSVGGQVAGLLDNGHLIDGMITMSAQSGHWRMQGGEQKWTTAFHVHITLPLLARMFGYMPWSWFSPAEDLPKGAAIEWSRWCRDPLYLLGDDTLPLQRFAKFTAPVLAYSFGDDKWGRPEAVDAMMSAYPNVERRHVEPARYQLESIGHFGYFRPQSSELWADSFEWLDAIATSAGDSPS